MFSFDMIRVAMQLPFTFTIKKHAKAKSIKIRIDGQGRVLVTKPPFVPDFMAKQFLYKNADWVTKQLSTHQFSKPKLHTKEYVHIFGKKYQKRLVFWMKKKIGVYTKDEELIYNPPDVPQFKTTDEKEKWDKKFFEKTEQFLKSTATQYIIKRTEQIAAKMKLSYNKISLKQQKTRWGSCSSKKNLNFNWKLVHFKTAIIDYVIIHELAHLKHMDHSKSFWELVEKYDPEYRKHVGWLKRNGMTVG